MTTLTTDITGPRTGLFQRLGATLRRGLERHAHAASRRDQIEAMEALSDAELSRLGLRREEIVAYVFRDLYYV